MDIWRNRSIWRLETGRLEKVIFAAGAAGEINVVDACDNNRIAYRKLTPGWINGLAYSNTSDSLAVATSRGELFYINALSLEPSATMSTGKWLNGIKRVGKTETFIVTTAEGEILIWDTHANRLECFTERHSDQVWDCSVSSDGDLLLTAGGNGEIALWSIQRKKQICWLSRGGYTVTSVVVLDKLDLAASVDMGGGLTLWSLSDLRAATRFQAHDARIWNIAASRNQEKLLTVSADYRAVVWEVATLHAGSEYQLGVPATAALFHNETNRIVVGDRNGAINFLGSDCATCNTPLAHIPISEHFHGHQVVAYIKRTMSDQVGKYSQKLLDVLDMHGIQYIVRDITDEPLREQSLIRLSGCPLFPQLYVSGKFIGGSEVVTEMLESGVLVRLLSNL